MPNKRSILVGSDAAGVTKHLGDLLQVKISAAAKGGNEPFVIGLSGGSLPKFFAAAVPAMQVDWSKVKFIFCDERLVPFDHEDSTYRLYR